MSWQDLDFSPIATLGKTYQDARQRDMRERTLAELGQGDLDYNRGAQKLLAVGDVQGAMSLAALGHNNRDFDFKVQEANRAQGNTDRTFGFQQTEAQRAQGNTDRSFGLDSRKVDISENDLKIIPYGGGVMKKDGTMIREPNAGGLLDNETISAMADQYRAGDTSVLTNLGRGAQGPENIVKLRQAIAAKNAAVGEGGAEQAGRNAEFFGVKSGQRTLGVKQANIELAATEFKQVLPVIMEASNAVNRTNYPDLNKIIQAYETKTGDPAIVKFGGGVNTLVNLYARAISPSGTPTVADKEHAREILNVAWSKNQFGAAVGMMQQEIDAALQSPEKVRDDMRKRFLGGQPGAAKPAQQSGPAVPAAPQRGEVRDGFRYIGGDPASPESWQNLRLK